MARFIMVRVLALVALVVAIGMVRSDIGVGGKVALGVLFAGCLFLTAWMTRVANKRRERLAAPRHEQGAEPGGPTFGSVPAQLGAQWNFGVDDDWPPGQQQPGRPRRWSFRRRVSK